MEEYELILIVELGRVEELADRQGGRKLGLGQEGGGKRAGERRLVEAGGGLLAEEHRRFEAAGGQRPLAGGNMDLVLDLLGGLMLCVK